MVTAETLLASATSGSHEVIEDLKDTFSETCDVDPANHLDVATVCEDKLRQTMVGLNPERERRLEGDESGTEAPAKSKEEQLLEEALKTGSFDLRGAVGRAWAAEKKLNKVLAKQYEELGKSYERQRAFRLQWAKQRKSELRKRRYETHEQSLSDNTECEYLSFLRVWEMEGKDVAGLEATKNYWISAMQLWSKGVTLHGKEHLKLNVRTKRPEVLYVREKITFSETHRWGMTQEQHSDPPDDNDGGPDGQTNTPNQPNNQGTKNKLPPGEPGNGGKVPKIDPVVEQTRKKLRERLQKADKIKGAMNAACSSAEDLLGIIAKDQEWSWANNEHALRELRGARSAIVTFKESSSFYRDWTVSDSFASLVKKKYKDDDAMAELSRLGEIDKKVATLSREVACLKRMHLARKA